MFYSPKDGGGSTADDLREDRVANQLQTELEALYDKYHPRSENPLYESINAFMTNVVARGVTPALAEPIYKQVAQLPYYKLKNAVNNLARQTGELLAQSECDEQLTYMQELSMYGLDGPTEGGPNMSRRKLCETQLLNGNESYGEGCEFEYFDKVYQTADRQDQCCGTQQRCLGYSKLEPLVIAPLVYQPNYTEWKEQMKQFECISEIQPDEQSLLLSIHSGGGRKDRPSSILLVQKNIVPIIQKEKNTEITISLEYQKLLEEYKDPAVSGSRKTRQSQRIPHRAQPKQQQYPSSTFSIEPASSSTKESLRKLTYKTEYDKKLKTGLIAARTNPYQFRRRV